jgi:hypothetical protein
VQPVGLHEDFLGHILGVRGLAKDAPGGPEDSGTVVSNDRVPIHFQSGLLKLGQGLG